MKIQVIFFLLILTVGSRILHGQVVSSPTRAELEQRKAEYQKELDEANRQLSKVQKNRKLTLRQAQLLQSKIYFRNQLIGSISQEIGLIDGDIIRANRDIRSLENDLDTLKTQYAQLVVNAYKNRSAYDYLNFILSAHSFNEAIKRYEYLKQYQDYRRHQAASIVETQDLLKEKIENLSRTRLTRRRVLGGELQQKKTLEQEKLEKDQMVNSMKGRERELLTDILEKKRAQNKLTNQINILIRREIADARRKALEESAQTRVAGSGKTAPANKATEPSSTRVINSGPASEVLEATPEDKLISRNFEGNKGKLPWPVKRGFISDPYGRHQHPLLVHVETQNFGVNIDTDRGATARAVFTGQVVALTFDPYTKWTVMLRHGQFFTVYSNLMRTEVQQGQVVQTKQPLGIVYTNDQTDETYIHFLIYRGFDSQNPALWLSSSH